MNLTLSKIPQSEYGDIELIPWSLFLKRAARGSFKAPRFLSNAERAVLTLNHQYLRKRQSYQNYERSIRETLKRSGSYEYNDKIQDCFDELLGFCILELMPTKAPLEIFQDICKSFDLNPSDVIIKQFTNHDADSSTYNCIWRIQGLVDEGEVLRDSLSYCLQNWSPLEYLRFRRAIKQDIFNYNSQYVTSAILMLSATWILWGRKPALN